MKENATKEREEPSEDRRKAIKNRIENEFSAILVIFDSLKILRLDSLLRKQGTIVQKIFGKLFNVFGFFAQNS